MEYDPHEHYEKDNGHRPHEIFTRYEFEKVEGQLFDLGEIVVANSAVSALPEGESWGDYLRRHATGDYGGFSRRTHDHNKCIALGEGVIESLYIGNEDFILIATDLGRRLTQIV